MDTEKYFRLEFLFKYNSRERGKVFVYVIRGTPEELAKFRDCRPYFGVSNQPFKDPDNNWPHLAYLIGQPLFLY